MTVQKCYNLARNASEFSDYRQHKLGCVAIYHNKVIAVAYNTNKSNPLQARYNSERDFDSYKYPAKIHAEMAVIAKIRHMEIDMSKVELYIYRGHANGIMALSKPCRSCEKAIRDMGIKRIFYTGENSFISERYE